MLTLQTSAQRSCGTPLAIKQALQRNPKLLKKYERLQHLSLSDFPGAKYERGMPIGVIPVVVHIVLADPRKVTDAQVRSQIKVLNQDYQLENADTTNVPAIWKPIEGDMKIEFRLAARTPSGNPTDGIDRVSTNVSTFGINYAAENVKHASTGGADAWDTDDYLNIWVCNLEGDNLGVGTPPGLYPKEEQGVVIQYNAFGTTGNLLPEYNKGRSCTHEIGHFFNLLHPWGDGDGSCSPGDYVADTPPQSGPVYGTHAFPYKKDPCSPNYPGVMLVNFMGYADDAAMDMFTQDQVNRAKVALLGPRSSLLSSNGADPVNLKQVDARLTSISNPHGKLCVNKIAPAVTLENFGTDLLKKVTITYMIGSDTGAVYHWTGKLSSLDSVNISLPASTIAIGNYQMKIFTTSPNDKPDQRTSNDTLRTHFHLDPEATAPFDEGFETDSFPPPGWSIRNPDSQYTWQKTSLAAHSGSYSVVMKNFDYQANGPVDDLISPVFNLQNADSAFLFFDVAAAVQSDPQGNNQYWDTLQVLISNDCAQTGYSLYKKWGANLITDTVPATQQFVPNARQWRRDSIDLTPYLSKGKFQIIFRNITNFENNIYLDDIQIKTKAVNPILKERKILVVPNPTSGRVSVQFLNVPTDLKSISIYNALGQLIVRKSADAISEANRIEFNLANEANGVYFVKISYTGHQIVKKIVKIK